LADVSVATEAEVAGRRCDHPTCGEGGDYRAPKSPQQLDAYFWFCLEHVRAYNTAWNYFSGMSQTEIGKALGCKQPDISRDLRRARERGLVLHARADEYAIRKLFELGPELRILWAHGGMFTPPGAIGELIGRFPRLWVDLSLRGDVAHNGKLNPEWREVLLRHPDRFVLGSGTYTTELWYQFRFSFDRFREWLRELPPGPAERIAFRNGLELFNVNYVEPRKTESRVTR